MKVFPHLPFARGLATIVPVTAPHGRYGGLAPRHDLATPICLVVTFREGQPAEQASFFGTAGVWQWIEQQLGPFQPGRLRATGLSPEQAHRNLTTSLAASRLL